MDQQDVSRPTWVNWKKNRRWAKYVNGVSEL